jgi:hypothetical protein
MVLPDMPVNKKCSLEFWGEHKPTGARIYMRYTCDGQETRGEGAKCPLCGGEFTLVQHARTAIGGNKIRTAAQCVECKTWFEQDDAIDDEPSSGLAVSFE